ncbi:hypothetical protein PZA11_005566 [Diplocarpon coronariae]
MSGNEAESQEAQEELQWGEDTDYLFHQDPLPKLATRPGDSNARVLGRLLRQKLVYRIQLQTGREISKKNSHGQPNPFVSDPAPPQFYAWKFTDDYPGFPEGFLSSWSIQSVRDCNNALENGDLYLTDVRYPCSRPSPRSSSSLPFDASQQGLLAAKLDFRESRAADRKRLIAIAEGAFTNYIVQVTGNSNFKFETVLRGNDLNQAQGLPGFRWVFPTVGLRKFPANTFCAWSSDELLYGLHGLLTKTVILERRDPTPDPVAPAHSLPEAHNPQESLEQGAPSRHGEPSAVISDSNTQFIDLESDPASSSVAFQTEQLSRSSLENHSAVYADKAILNAEPGAGLPVPEKSGAAIFDHPREGFHGLDDLIAQLNSRTEIWKADWARLQKYELRERDFLAQMADKELRIKELEGALNRLKNLGSAQSNSGSGSGAGASYPAVESERAMKALGAFYSGQVSELRAQNEELTGIIQDQEEAVRESDQLRRRIRGLEKQLADKSSEASVAYEILNSYAHGYNSSKHGAHNQAMNPLSFTNDSGARFPGRYFSVQDANPKDQAKLVRCDRCKTEKQRCTNPGGPCICCLATGKQCTFELTDSNTKFPTTSSSHNTSTGDLDVGDAVAQAKRVAKDTARFLEASRLQNQNTPQGQYQTQGQYPPQATYTSNSTPQFGSDSQFGLHRQLFPSKRPWENSTSTNNSLWELHGKGQKRQNGDDGNGESNKSPRVGSYKSPYSFGYNS